MGLFNDAGNLLEIFMPQQNNEVKDTMINRAEVDKNDFEKIVAVGLPAIINAINRNNQSETGLESFNNALTKHQDVKNYNSLDQLTRDVDEQDGDKILGHIFNQNNNEKQGIIDKIANTLGISEGAVKRVLVLLAPMILKYFADRKDSKQLDASGVQKESGELSDIMTRSIRDFGAQKRDTAQNDGGIFGDLFGGSQPTQTRAPQQENDGGLLDDIFDMFK